MPDQESFEFTGAAGQTLAGVIHRPAVKPIAWAIFAHCFSCSKQSRAARYVSTALAERGIATLRFDFTGLGESEGEFRDAFANDVRDVVAAADALRSASHAEAPALLVGHSRGGTAALAASARIPECTAVATIGAPYYASRLAGALDTDGIASLKKALLIFHSPQDNIVSIDDAREIFVAARHPKSFVSLDGADHLLGRQADARYVASVLSSWAERYLPSQPEPDRAEDTPEGVVVVEGKTTGFIQDIRTRDMIFASDEPLDKGGTNAAPTPYDLLLASLGACTSMTLKMYAGRKEWPLESVRVTLRHHRVHAKDCEDCEKDTGMIDVIEKELEVEGELDDEQRARLLEISARCPVHRTLLNEIKIRSELI
jgi:putative redox protein